MLGQNELRSIQHPAKMLLTNMIRLFLSFHGRGLISHAPPTSSNPVPGSQLLLSKYLLGELPDAGLFCFFNWWLSHCVQCSFRSSDEVPEGPGGPGQVEPARVGES